MIVYQLESKSKFRLMCEGGNVLISRMQSCIFNNLHHPHSVKDYHGDEDPPAVKISQYWFIITSF
jgi:hypothetical protein